MTVRRMMKKLMLVLLLVSFTSVKLAETIMTPTTVARLTNLSTDYQPQQVHLSWTGHDGEMTVTWSTMKLPPAGEAHFSVRFGTTSTHLNESAAASVTEFVDGGTQHRSQFIYRATMQRMSTNATYFYTVGSDVLRSGVFRFRSLPQKSSPHWSPRLMVFGDLGTANDRSLREMTREVDAAMHDMVLHNGDFAYDMDSDEGRRGDAFMREIEPIAAQLPYMTTAGNHEYAYNFSHYRNRFSMPGGSENFFYSLDVGPMHMVLFTSDWYVHPFEYVEQLWRQYEWMEEDLRKARARNTQWIVAVAHRPLYCSNRVDVDCCNPLTTVMRDGLPPLGLPGFEQLFYRYGVDLFLGAHEHSYERNWPTFVSTVRNGTRAQPYRDALATVYITSGAAGDVERQDAFLKQRYPWTAFRSLAYGFARLMACNATHIYIEQVGLGNGSASVIDSVWLSKTRVTPAWLR